jgi:hypothetical protein
MLSEPDWQIPMHDPAPCPQIYTTIVGLAISI